MDTQDPLNPNCLLCGGDYLCAKCYSLNSSICYECLENYALIDNECFPIICTSDHITCINGKISGELALGCKCNCLIGYTSETCEVKIPCDDTDITCFNNGNVTGTKVDNNCKCDCIDEFEGDFCGIKKLCND